MKKSLLLISAILMLTASSAMAQYEPVTVTVDSSTGSFTASNPSGTWHSEYTSTAENGIILSCSANNMVYDGSNLKLYRGGYVNSMTYTITAKNPDYYVCGYSFSAKAAASQTLSVMGGTATEVSNTATTAFSSGTIAEGTPATFDLAGDNNGTVFSNFTVTIRPRVLPHEDGWYTIQTVLLNGSDVPNYVVCANEEYKQSSTNFYSLKFVTAVPEETPATQFIRIEMVDATQMHVYGSNGHGVSYYCTSAKDVPSSTVMAVADPDNGTMTIGEYWNVFNPSDGTENPYVGKSQGAGANRFKMVKADPEAIYDIWTVNITGAEATAEVKDNARIVLNREENKGLKKVYNHGKFFVTKGTTLAASDFTADQYDSNTAPIITLDNEAKTITVDYSMTQSSKSKCLELAHQKIDDLYVPYAAQCFYADGIVAKAIEAAKAKITAAAGGGSDDAPVSDEVFQAVASAVEAAPTALAADVAAFNKSAVGTLIHLNNDRDGGYSRRLTVSAEGNAQTQPKNNNLSEIWVIASSDENGNLSLQNYETGKYLNAADNTSSTWTTVDAPDATYGFFVINPRLNGTNYPVELHNVGSNNHFMHAKAVNSQGVHEVIGWTTDASGYGSAWLITLAEADEVAATIESAQTFVNTHKISFTHSEGLTLRSDITYLPCHNIIVSKIVASAGTDEGQSRAVDTSFEPISIAPTDMTECENGFTADLDVKLGEGNYEVKVPAAIFLVGSGDTAKLSKAYESSFYVDSNGETTGIGDVIAPAVAADVIYDLQGRRLVTPVRGLNIINGRKVLVK